MESSQPLPFGHISPKTLAQRLPAEGDTLQLIDVREPEEVAIAHLPQFQVLSLSQFPNWSGNIHSHLEADKETIVMCHHGMRSAQMCQWLCQQGFTNVKNLTGGIDAYAVTVDSSLPRY